LIAQATENQATQPGQSNELLRLRGEVARLRQDAKRSKSSGDEALDDPSIQAVIQLLATRVTQLRQKLDQMPNRKIPELKYLSDKDWLAVVGDVEKMENDDEFRAAMSSLRSRAKSVFGSKLRKALRGYADANGDMLPTDITQLQPFFDQPADLAALQRYQIAEAGKLDEVGSDKILIKEIGPRVDDDYDSHFEFSLNGTSSHSGSSTGDALEKAATAYANANGGSMPKTPEQLAGYLQQEVDPARMQKFLGDLAGRRR
jgi:hypothetical protein